MLVRRVSGAPPTSTVNAAVTWRAVAMTVPEATPVATPALSPLVIGIEVIKLCAGAEPMNTLGTKSVAVGPIAMFG